MQSSYSLMTQFHIDAAISELQEAKEQAEMGTAMMIQTSIDRLRDIRDNYNEINDETNSP